jgi:hypothetical protein
MNTKRNYRPLIWNMRSHTLLTRRSWCSGFYRRVDLPVDSNVLEEHTATVFRVYPSTGPQVVSTDKTTIESFIEYLLISLI